MEVLPSRGRARLGLVHFCAETKELKGSHLGVKEDLVVVRRGVVELDGGSVALAWAGGAIQRHAAVSFVITGQCARLSMERVVAGVKNCDTVLVLAATGVCTGET